MELVGGVGGEADGRRYTRFARYDRVHGGGDHGLAAEVHRAQEGDFLVRSRGQGHGVHKPGSAQGGVVHQRGIVAVQHHVAGVQGVEHRRTRGHPRLHGLQGIGGIQLPVQSIDFPRKIVLYQILVPLQLSRRIAAHALVMVRRHGGVEHVHREVQHTVLRVFIGLDNLVYRPLRKGLAKVLGGGEMVCVKVPLAHDEQVGGAKHADAQGRRPLAPEAGHLPGMFRLPLREIGP